MKGKKTRILAIETSCDETAVAVLEVASKSENRELRIENVVLKVLVHLVSSQISIHQKYGGVVPEVAARSHVPETVALITHAVASCPLESMDAIAVTRGPGLATALSVGLEAARVLSAFADKPLIGINHLEGHIASAWLNEENRAQWNFPLLALIVSGGHTELVLMKDFCRYKVIGQTRDDAAGEAFDKSAKLMGMAYPGGPLIAKLAETGNPTAYSLPRPMLRDDSLDFSFSGLKTAVRQTWEKSIEYRVSSIENTDPIPDTRYPIPDTLIPDLAASLQAAIVEVLVEKTLAAAKKFRVKGVCLVGGVSANVCLRMQLGKTLKERLPEVSYLPSDAAYITDNAAMIAAAGYWRFQKGEIADWRTMQVKPEWNL